VGGQEEGVEESDEREGKDNEEELERDTETVVSIFQMSQCKSQT